MFALQKTATFILLVYYEAVLPQCKGLQIRSSQASPSTFLRASNVNCNQVLTKELECPSIGSFPVAGHCGYFARCIQTENGVESEVDFCPDGEVYVVNRCVRSNNDDCPQKTCAQAYTPMRKHISNSLFPTNLIPNVPNEPILKPAFSTTKSPFHNLHPSINGAVYNSHRTTVYPFLLLLLLYIS